MVGRLQAADHVHVAAVYDVDERKRRRWRTRPRPSLPSPDAVIGHGTSISPSS
jgi:hypothetical protein